MLSRKIILLSLAAATTTLQAATEFPDGLVPGDVAAEFAGGTILQGLPDDFPPMTVPAGLDLRVIGSMQESGYSQTILLGSALAREQLAEGLRSMLTGQGWLDASVSLGISGGSLLRFCHDTYGELSINSTPTSYGTRLRVSRGIWPAGYTRMSCSEQQALQAENADRVSLYNGLMPILEVPEGTVASRPAAGFIASSASSAVSATRVGLSRDGGIEVPDTNAADLHDYFAAQMQEQGWQVDSSDAGSKSAASVWTKALAGPGAIGDTVFVTLTVLGGADDFYSVHLSLRSSPVESGPAGIVGVTPF